MGVLPFLVRRTNVCALAARPQLVRTLGKKACDVTAKITTFSANLSWKIRVEKNIEPA